MPAPAPRGHLLRALDADLIGPYHLDEPEEETQGEEPENKRQNRWPASIGLSILVPKATREVQATVRFAQYVLERRWWNLVDAAVVVRA